MGCLSIEKIIKCNFTFDQVDTKILYRLIEKLATQSYNSESEMSIDADEFRLISSISSAIEGSEIYDEYIKGV